MQTKVMCATRRSLFAVQGSKISIPVFDERAYRAVRYHGESQGQVGLGYRVHPPHHASFPPSTPKSSHSSPPSQKKKARLRSKCACTVFFAKTPKNHRHEILSALSSFYKRPNFAETMSLSSRPKRSRVLLSWVLFAEKHIPPAHVTVKQAYRTM